MRPLFLPQGIGILLHRCFRSACTLKLLLPLLPVCSNVPPFLVFLVLFFVASSPCLFSIISLSSTSHRNSFCIHSLSSGLISVSIHCSKSQSGGGVCKKCNCYRTKKIMQDVIWHKHQFLTILLMRRWWSVGSNAKLEHIQYLCLYVSSSSDLATLQGSPQKHMGTRTPLGRGNGSKAFLVNRP